MIFGLLLYWILKIKIVNILDPELFKDYEGNDNKNLIAFLLAGVIGGFSERLVPDILSKKAGEADGNNKNEDTDPSEKNPKTQTGKNDAQAEETGKSGSKKSDSNDSKKNNSTTKNIKVDKKEKLSKTEDSKEDNTQHGT